MIIKSQSQIKDNENGLYLVSTPIGNLKDITLRAIETLKKSDYILCEDTRVSKNLLDRYEIKSKLISNHKFNEKKNINRIVNFLKLGKKISLISDAGTPSISDPGAILVNECVKNNIRVLYQYLVHQRSQRQFQLVVFQINFSFTVFFQKKNKHLINELQKLIRS